MTQRQIAIRIGLDGKADIQRDQDAIAASGEAAWGRLGKAIDQATSAIERQKAKQDALAQSIANTKTQAANQAKFNEVLGVGTANAAAGGAPGSAAASAFSGLERQAAALRAQINPLGVAQEKLNGDLKTANDLFSQGAITVEEQAAAHALARQRYDATAKALGVVAGEAKLSAYAMTNLGFQVNDVVSGLAMGQAPLRILAQQGGQIYQVFASERGGVMGALKAVGTSIGEFLLSPLGLAVTEFVVVGGAAVAGFARAKEAEKQFTDATTFAGRAAGLTREQFEGIAEAGAKSADISVNAARDIESAFARTGTVGAQSLEGLIDLTKDFADKTGKSMDEARDALTGAFSDPARAGEKLLSSMGALDDKTAQLIQRYLTANDVVGAQKTLQDALTKALKQATDQTTWYGNAWEWVKKQISGAAEAASHPFKGISDAEQLANLKDQLAGAQADNPNGYRNAQIAALKAQIAPIQARVDAANAEAKKAADDAAAVKLSLAAGPLVRGAIPGFDDKDTLERQKAVLDQLANNDAALKKTGASLADVTAAQDSYNHAIQTYLDPATKAAKLNELEIAALNAKTPEQKASIAAQREAVELAGKVISTADANAKIQQASALAYAQAQRAVDKHTDSLKANLAAQLAVADAYLKGTGAGLSAEEGGDKLVEQIGKSAINGAKQVAQLRDETAARKALNDQVAAGAITTEQASQQLAVENSLAPLRVAYDLAEGDAKKELAKIIAALTAARKDDNAAINTSRALADVEASNRNLDLLKQQLAIANDNDSTRQVELAVLQEKQNLLRENIDAESAEGKQLLANAAAAAQIKQQIDLAAQSRGEIESMFDGFTSKFQNFIDQGKFGWKDFASFALSELQDIEDEMIKLAAINPLKNALFDSNLPTLGSVGVGLSGLFGGGEPDLSPISVTPDIFGQYHGGGMAGAANRNRALPPNVVRFAPRFHRGAFLGPDEVPGILQTGEQILNRQETRDYRNKRAGGGVTFAPGSIQIVANDPSSFKASKGQILSTFSRAVQAGMRGL